MAVFSGDYRHFPAACIGATPANESVPKEPGRRGDKDFKKNFYQSMDF